MSLNRLLIVALAACLAVEGSVSADEPNKLTQQEQESGFELLFDGQSLDGWNQKGNWAVEDGAIARKDRGGSLTHSEKLPDDFELRFEWKVGEGSNSGVYYRPGQYEYQILDSAKHVDGKNPRTSAASLYFCMPPSHDATAPVGEWNRGRIVCQKNVIQHWLNGEKVVDFDYTDPEWAANVELLRLRGGDVAARGAHLSLQDHGDPVWYRSIRLRSLSEEDSINHSTVTPAVISEEALKAEKAKLERILKNREKQAENAKSE
ncbi:hypothetical protein KOR42_44910 [Thalassoglobus neptunius]|uniref:3-keto-alpha-glucoside-1,2-lyase/3-keto-2-hydroxy-glucal hydratase domain-containing protein n=1 Tax=Thalassoglobus neptunius TaxID=1938619 RepID=A0A5C5VYH6_9PLAN|nr:DUF1080 domain-containing protein [Thalassoglobus neptunius]TWT43085.1 hypothetical protein KOR42_44910 [Thalassoglobus neptunius]